MGEAIRGVSEPTPLSPGAEPPASIGRYLAQQRELRGIGREELAELTRIPLRSIERLESGAFDDDPDGFVRGFVRTVAAAIGLDPDETVTRMLAEPVPTRGVPMPDWRGIALVATLLVAFVGLSTWAFGRWSAPPEAPELSAPEPAPVRTDPVRALARERGLLPEGDAERRAPEAMSEAADAPAPSGR